jgi:ABC-type glycerol-3-phosphate transport system permease component
MSAILDAKTWRRMTVGKFLAGAFQYFTLVAMSIVILLPLVVTFMASFKTPLEAFNGTPLDLPGSLLNVANYLKFLGTYQVGLSFFNTGLVMVCALTVVSLAGSGAAYVLDRFRFPGRRLIMLAYLLVISVPAVTTQVATYRVMLGLGLVGTKWSLVTLYSATDVISLYIFLQYIATIPRELDESARMEGASYVTVFWKIILPLMGPAVSTVLILRSIYIYNDFVFPYIYTPRVDQSTISMLLFVASDALAADAPTVLMAGIMIITIPALIAFFLLQKRIIAGVTRGAVKG